MFDVESSFSLKYFVFGFKDKLKKDVVLGAYDTRTGRFFIDYLGEKLFSVKDSYKKSVNKALPFVYINGVGVEKYADAISKDYILGKSFFCDYMAYASSDPESNGYIEVGNAKEFEIMVGLSGDLVWNTGRVYERCSVSFSYDDYFESFSIDINPLENVSVVPSYSQDRVTETKEDIVDDISDVLDSLKSSEEDFDSLASTDDDFSIDGFFGSIFDEDEETLFEKENIVDAIDEEELDTGEGIETETDLPKQSKDEDSLGRENRAVEENLKKGLLNIPYCDFSFED